MAVSVSDREFAAFLVSAKLHTYAARDVSSNVIPVLPGSRQLEYQEGALLYRDIYFGVSFSSGKNSSMRDPRRCGPWATQAASSHRIRCRGSSRKYTSFSEQRYGK